MPDNFAEIYALWKKEEITAKEAMEILNIKSNTFYRFVKNMRMNALQKVVRKLKYIAK